jgi:hypothetical protein
MGLDHEIWPQAPPLKEHKLVPQKASWWVQCCRESGREQRMAVGNRTPGGVYVGAMQASSKALYGDGGLSWEVLVAALHNMGHKRACLENRGQTRGYMQQQLAAAASPGPCCWRAGCLAPGCAPGHPVTPGVTQAGAAG